MGALRLRRSGCAMRLQSPGCGAVGIGLFRGAQSRRRVHALVASWLTRIGSAAEGLATLNGSKAPESTKVGCMSGMEGSDVPRHCKESPALIKSCLGGCRAPMRTSSHCNGRASQRIQIERVSRVKGWHLPNATRSAAYEQRVSREVDTFVPCLGLLQVVARGCVAPVRDQEQTCA